MSELEALLTESRALNQQLQLLIVEQTQSATSLASIAASLKVLATNSPLVAEALQKIASDMEVEVTGIVIQPSPPTPKVTPMKCTLVKKSMQKIAARAAHAAAAVVAFQIQDNENSTCTVLGVDAAGNTLDISGVATLTPPPTSDAPTILTVGAPTGMTFPMTAVGPLGSANVMATATWNTPGTPPIGPFTFTLPVSVVAGPAGGIVIQPGTPTVKP